MRGVAALLVIFFHQRAILNLRLPTALETIIDHLYLSVHLFFVVSAFTLFHSHHCSPVSTTNYLIKRFFRIAPLFYTALLFQIWQSGLPDVATTFLNFSLLFNLAPGFLSSINWAGWSIGVECLFYLLLAALFLRPNLIYDQMKIISLALVGTFLTVFIWGLAIKYPGVISMEYAYFSFVTNLTPFFFGLAAYATFLKHSGNLSIGSRRLIVIIAPSALLIFCYFDPINLHWNIAGLYFAL